MHCPACDGSLYKSTLHKVEIDACSLCQGIWFDDGKLTHAANEIATKESTKSTGNEILFKKRSIATSDPDEGYRMCPKCTVTLKKTNFAYDSNIFVDKCGKCHGIWTDKGEIKQIAGFLKSDPQTREFGKALIKREKEKSDLNELAEAGKMVSRRAAVWYLFSPTFMMPLGDDNKIDHRPIVTYFIIAACSMVFALQLFFMSNQDTVFNTFGYLPSKYLSLRSLTSIFLHGSILHLIANMFFLWLFGKSIEGKLGVLKFTALFFGSAYCGCFSHSFLGPDLSVPVIGASGAVSGVMGAYLALFPKSRLKVFWMGTTVHLPAYLYLVLWFLMQLTNSLLYKDLDFTNVAWFSHIGGFAFGYSAARIFDHMDLSKTNK